MKENHFCWEQQIFISHDLNSSSNFIVYFFGNDEYDESQSSLNIYEVLMLLFVNGCLNHDL